MPDTKVQLLAKIDARRTYYRQWGCANLWFTQSLIIVGVLSSLASTIAIASGRIPTVIAAILAGIPGCVIVIERSFNFMRQSRWHYLLAAELESLMNALEHEGKTVEAISIEFSRIMLEYERSAPSLSLTESASKKK